MRIGVRAHDYGRHAPDVLAAMIAADGFECVQLAPTKALWGIEKFEDITERALDEAREGFAKSRIRIDVMGCYMEIGARDDEERKSAVDRFCTGIGYAKRLGAPLVATETTGFSGTDEEREGRYLALREGVLRMAEAAEKHGVIACVEPVAVHTIGSAKLARRLLDEVGSKHLKIVFDPVNMLTVGNFAEQDKIMEEYFALLGADIAAVHVKDVDAGLGWRNIGDGDVNLPAIFTRLTALGRDLALLREEVRPDSAKIDIEGIRRLVAEL